MKQFILLTFLTSILFCQSQAQSSWPDSSKHQGLNLKTELDRISVFTSQEASIDEVSLQLLQNAKRYFDQVFEMDFPVSVLFVSNAEWGQYAFYPPPGMPQAWAGNIFLGSEKSVVAIHAEQQLKYLPEAQLAELKRHFGDPLNMDLFYRNNLSVHELGHLYHFVEATQAPRKWLQEVFATWAERAYLVKHHPNMADATAAYAKMGTKLLVSRITYTSLEKFEELYLPGLGPQNYEWFQFQLFQKAVKLHQQFGTDGLVKLRDFLVATDKAMVGSLDDTALQELSLKHLGYEATEVLFEWNY
ncbi:hypothetical protein [Shivajiella indica]|uniref:DUF1570 domain-containing protein n=1 Tax=Shivajiella indica TaxID=872115 RepID=A0ABW5B533_9BACT